MRTRIVDSPVAAGELLAGHILEAFRGRPHFVLGAPAGRTPVTTFDNLRRHQGELGGLVLAMMDEYVVAGGWCARDAHYSCRRFADEQLPGVPATFPDPADPAAYDTWLDGLGGADLFLIASGASDGHVGFNPPGTPLDSSARVVELAESTRRDNLATFPDFASLDEVPGHGVTCGLRSMTGAREAVLVLLGEAKRESFRRVGAAHEYEPAWPATVIHACRNPWILADEAAAS